MPYGSIGVLTMTPRTYDRIVTVQNELAMLLDALDMPFAVRTRLIGAIRTDNRYRAALTEMCFASGQGEAENAKEQEERYKGELSDLSNI